jgi:signal transduction histidine kinase
VITTTTDFGDAIAARMRTQHRALAARWFERLLDILPVNAREIFPTDNLLDHVPSLILEISDYLRQPEGQAIVSNTLIIDKASELGALRHEQQASLHQVLREYQILGNVLVTFVLEELEGLGLSPAPADAIQLVSRVHQAVGVLAQATVEVFVGLYTRTIADQAARLDEFTRMAAHEWRQPLGALQFGVRLLREKPAGPSHEHTLTVLERNVHLLVELTRKLESIARIRTSSGDSPALQAVSVATIAQEAARQLREMAEARNVDIRVADTQATAVVDVGRLELAFVNLVSNAIKYSDRSKTERYVQVVADGPEDGWLRIRVTDNGIGIPRAALSKIFDRFTRAHTDNPATTQVGGIGLGLSIVEDCVRAMGGFIEVESEETRGTTFTLRLPAQATP